MPLFQGRWIKPVAVCSLAVFLAACNSAETRAQKHFETAQELMASGDVSRAIVEFRNVFQNAPNHKQARLAFADLMADQGQYQEAYRSYLLVSEQYPSEAAPRIELAELAILSRNWDEAERHGLRAIEAAPDDPRVKIIKAVLDYRTAIQEDDAPARREAANQIAKIRDTVEDQRIATQTIIDNLLRDGEYRAALTEVDRILAIEPDNEALNQLKLQVLGQLGDDEGIKAQLQTLIDTFPENASYQATLIQWYVSRGEMDSAEAFIRSRIPEPPEGEAERTLLITFLQQTKGVDAAEVEVKKAIEAGINPTLFRAMHAGLTFDRGDRNDAIAMMEEIIDGAEPSNEINGLKVALARMQVAVGNEVAARQQVEEVLQNDSSQVDAIKLRAAWLVEDDRADEAIVALRTALDQAPNDPQIMSIMAQAHLRNGSRGLAREMLALATEAAGAAPAQSAEYARFLISDGDLTTAESTLIESLRVVPGSEQILTLLGDVYVRQEDWSRAEQVEATLRALDSPTSANTADSIKVARLRGQQKGDEALEFLESLAAESEGASPAIVAIVRSKIAGGDIADAESYVDSLLSQNPDDTVLRLLKAGVLQAAEKTDAAEAIYREVLAENSQNEGIWRALYLSRLRQGDTDGASGVLQEAIKAMPNAPNLQWALAGELERAGDFEGAIGIYETLYEVLSGSPIVANNLASLITTYRTDEQDLDRAYSIAKRLRGSDIPAFQDTYGWIAFRRGQVEDAIVNLEPAAAGLPQDPVVQFHLAQAYAAADRNEEALAQYRKALEVAGPGDTRQQFEIAREEITRLEALIAEQGKN